MKLRFISNSICRGLLWICIPAGGLQPALASVEQVHPLEPADLSSPRTMLNSFLLNTEIAYSLYSGAHAPENAEQLMLKTRRQIGSCFDLRETPDFMVYQVTRSAAVMLKEVLDRLPLPKDKNIPGPEEVMNGDGEPLEYWTIPQTEITIIRINEGPRKGDYVFSGETISRAREFYEAVSMYPYKEGATPDSYELFLGQPRSEWLREALQQMPDWTRMRLGELALWQWITMALLIPSALAVMMILFGLGRKFSRGSWRPTALRFLLSIALPFLSMMVPFAVRDFLERSVNISGSPMLAIKFTSSLLFLIAAMMVILALGNRMTRLILASRKFKPQGLDAQLVRLVCRIVSLTFAVIVFLEGGKYLGIPISTLLAGAGVSGFAIAMAAQDTLKNIFGSMMLVMDKPFIVGERIVVNGYDGIVEEIGLRSTRLRTLSGHLVAVPNEDMARTHIENIGRRPFIRRLTDIPLPLSLGAEEAQRAVDIVSGIIESHPGRKPEFPPRVYLSDIERDCLTLRFMYWFHPPNYWEYMDYAQAVNKQILTAFEEAGLAIALPATRTVLERETDGQLPG